MLGLLPAEYWEYKLRDVVRGIAATFDKVQPGGLNKTLYIPGIGNCIPARSGRAAIVVAIKGLNLPVGARIGVPLYNCPVVFKAIRAADCTPCFIDIERETLCMSADDLASKISQLDAVIAVHMFGNLCDMPGLQKAAQGKPIIEDCAQSLGSKIDGHMSGLYSTIAAFSFRSGKYLSVGEGGALFSGQPDVYSRLSQLTATLPVPSRAAECMHIGKTYIRSILRRKPLWGIVGQKLWDIYNKTVEFSSKSPLFLTQIHKADLAIAIHRLDNMDSIVEKNRVNADFYTRSLKLDSSMLCHEKPGSYYNRYLYPINFPSSKHRDLIATYLLIRKINTIKPYEDIVDIATKYFGYTGGCPVTEQISKRLLIIPSYYALNKKEVNYIAQCLNECCAEILSDRNNGDVL